jgi:hypothetical protein
MRCWRYWLLVLAGLVASGAQAAELRSSAARTAFVKANPCPATGKQRGACPGYVVDHVTPLCAGGADHHSNMQWQTVEDAKIKDREEIKLCRKNR